ncbi:YdhR family protein, partial [Escherichia coli]
MATLLQLHFAFNGPFGDAMVEQLEPLAESINQEPGFLWKVWTCLLYTSDAADEL